MIERNEAVFETFWMESHPWCDSVFVGNAQPGVVVQFGI